MFKTEFPILFQVYRYCALYNLETPLNNIWWTNAFLYNLRKNIWTNEIFYNTTCYEIDRSVALRNIVKRNVILHSNLLLSTIEFRILIIFIDTEVDMNLLRSIFILLSTSYMFNDNDSSYNLLRTSNMRCNTWWWSQFAKLPLFSS